MTVHAETNASLGNRRANCKTLDGQVTGGHPWTSVCGVTLEDTPMYNEDDIRHIANAVMVFLPGYPPHDKVKQNLETLCQECVDSLKEK